MKFRPNTPMGKQTIKMYYFKNKHIDPRIIFLNPLYRSGAETSNPKIQNKLKQKIETNPNTMDLFKKLFSRIEFRATFYIFVKHERYYGYCILLLQKNINPKVKTTIFY